MASILEQVWEYKKFSELTPTAAEKAIKQTTIYSFIFLFRRNNSQGKL